jgi:hypothetical protein
VATGSFAATAAGLRYRLLETIRLFAAERLAEADQKPAAALEAHCAHFLALAEEAAPRLFRPGQGIWLARLETEDANLLRAAEHAAGQPGGTSPILRFAIALWRHRQARYRHEERSGCWCRCYGAAKRRPALRYSPRRWSPSPTTSAATIDSCATRSDDPKQGTGRERTAPGPARTPSNLRPSGRCPPSPRTSRSHIARPLPTDAAPILSSWQSHAYAYVANEPAWLPTAG